MLAPIMPGLNDGRDQLAELVERAVLAGATHVSPIVLHLRPGVREVFWPWLERVHPGLVDRYTALYTSRRGGRAVATYRKEVEDFVKARRAEAWRRHGRPAQPPGDRAPVRTAPAHAQLSLL